MRTLHLYSLSILIFTSYFSFGCSKKKRYVENQYEIVAGSIKSKQYNAELIVVEQSGKISIKPEYLPEKVTSVSCKVNDISVESCSDGVILTNPNDGSYFVSMIVETASQDFNLQKRFNILGGKLFFPNRNDQESSDWFILAADDFRFKDYSAINIDKYLTIPLQIDTNRSCQAKFYCNQTQDMWSLCHTESIATLTIAPQQMVKGFQVMKVQAKCGERSSNIIDLHWFGVDENYQKLAVSKRTINQWTHFSLAKASDCTEQLSWQCRNSENESDTESFDPCINLMENPLPGFKIRATCTDSDENIIYGPIYQVPTI